MMSFGVVATSFECYAVLHNSPGQDCNLLKMCFCLLCCSVLSIFMAVWTSVCRYNIAVSEVCHMTLKKGQSQNKNILKDILHKLQEVLL